MKNNHSSNPHLAAEYSTQKEAITDLKLNLNPGKICGCMGTRHKLVGSCLSCGRVTCEMEYKNDGEGTEAEIEKVEEQIPPNMKLKKKVEEVAVKLNIQSGTILCNCFTCGQPVCAPMSCSDLSNQGSTLDAKTVTAYKQKDKLLLFDREHAKRTHVHDAQADYYETGTWLSEEEKKTMDENEQRRRDARKPTNRRFKMSFDMAGRRIIEAIEEEEEEEVGGYVEKETSKSGTCKDVQDDYYAHVTDDDNDDDGDGDGDGEFQDCEESASNTMKYSSNKSLSSTKSNGRNDGNNRSNIAGKSGRNKENQKSSNVSSKESGVVQVIENDSLGNSLSRAGDVYRSLRSSMAERAVKNEKDAKKKKNNGDVEAQNSGEKNKGNGRGKGPGKKVT